MQFQVPQFIDTENKIIAGKFTLGQFLIICVGGGASMLLFFVLSTIAWLIFTAFIAAIVLGLVFLRVNGRSAFGILRAAFFYYWNPSMYLWRGEEAKLPETPKIKTSVHEIREVEPMPAPLEAARARPEPVRYGTGSVSPPLMGPASTKVLPEKKLEEWEPAKPTPIQPTATPKPIEVAPITPAKPIKPSFPVFKPENLEEQIKKGGTLAEGFKNIRENLKAGKRVQGLWERMTTSKLSLPKREKPVSAFEKMKITQGYEALRKSTGEIVVARRVDYK